HPGDLLRLDSACPQQCLDEHAILVGRLLPAAGESPRDQQSSPIEHTDAGVGVADLDDEQHHVLLSSGTVAVVPDTIRVGEPRPTSTSTAPLSSTSIAPPSPPPGIRTRSPRVPARRRHSSRTPAKPSLTHSSYRRSSASSSADRSSESSGTAPVAR